MLRQNTTAGVSSRSAKWHLCGARAWQTHVASGGLGHAANRRLGVSLVLDQRKLDRASMMRIIALTAVDFGSGPPGLMTSPMKLW